MLLASEIKHAILANQVLYTGNTDNINTLKNHISRGAYFLLLLLIFQILDLHQYLKKIPEVDYYQRYMGKVFLLSQLFWYTIAPATFAFTIRCFSYVHSILPEEFTITLY